MRYRLRTLLIVLALGPMGLPASWPYVKPIADDFCVLGYGDVSEYYDRKITISLGAEPPKEPPGFHPVAEFLNKLLP